MAVSISLTDISRLPATNKKLRAYAYLRAAFEDQSGGNDTRDMLDCLLPFLTHCLKKQAGNQLDLEKLKEEIEDSFQLTIPTFAFPQFLKRAERQKLVRYNKLVGQYIVAEITELSTTDDTRSLSGDFDRLSVALDNYADSIGLSQPLTRANWTDVLIDFLKSGQEEGVVGVAKLGTAMIGNPQTLDARVAAQFVHDTHASDIKLFDSIVNVFTGVLIEDFIACVQDFGPNTDFRGVTLYYDTSILLRLLGCSGKILKTATLEMHQTLQDAGCSMFYFEHNESEMRGIFEAILHKVDYHHAVVGETGHALSHGEITVATLRDIEASYSILLGQLGIYGDHERYAHKDTAARHQIDERGFEAFLRNEALKKKVNYSSNNLENDARSLASIMHLRAGRHAQSLTAIKYAFITANSFLSRTARRFVSDKFYENKGWNYAAPFLTDEQITTYVWLLTQRQLKPENVSQELLANCYEAIQPDVDWTERFFSKIRDLDQFDDTKAGQSADQALWLTTARRVAEDESYGSTAILETVPLNEILAKTDKLIEEQKATYEQETKTRTKEAAEVARHEGQLEQDIKNKTSLRRKGRKFGSVISKLASILVFLLAVFFVVFQAPLEWQHPALFYAYYAGLGVFALIAAANLIEVSPISRISNSIQKLFERKFVDWFHETPES